MELAKRILSTTEEKILKNDLLDVQEWVTGALDGKSIIAGEDSNKNGLKN